MVGSSPESMESSGWETDTQIESSTLSSKTDHAYSRKSVDAPAHSCPTIQVFTSPLNSIPAMETEVTVSPSGSSPVTDTDISPPCTPSAPAVDMLPSDILDLDSIFEESLNIPNLIEEFSMEEVNPEEGIVIVDHAELKNEEDFSSNNEEESEACSLYEDAYFPVISHSELNKSILDSVIPFDAMCSPGSPITSDAGYESYGSPSSELSLSDSLAENLDDLFPILV